MLHAKIRYERGAAALLVNRHQSTAPRGYIGAGEWLVGRELCISIERCQAGRSSPRDA